VLSEETGNPLFNVAVFNLDKSKSSVTGFNGSVSLSTFALTEAIIFKHLAHQVLKTTKADILKEGNKVILQASENALDEVVMSVSKFSQKEKEVSQKIVSIKAKDIIAANPQTSADLLESSGQVFVQKSQLGGGSPIIRGFSTNRLLITVDGVRFNMAIFRGGNVQNIISIDPLAIEQTEVILGSGSMVYGSDAVGGVMNFYSKKPKLLEESSATISGNALVRYATANTEKTGHIDVNFSKEKWAFLTSISYSDFDDLKMGSHGLEDYLRPDYQTTQNGQDITVVNNNPKVQVETGFNQIYLMQKARFSPNTNWDFNLGVSYSETSNYPRYDRLIRKSDGEFRAAEWFYGPQTWLSINLDIHQTQETTLYDEANFTIAYQKFEESRNDRNYGENIRFETDEVVNAYSTNLDFTKSLGRHKVFYGLEYVYNKVGSFGKQTDITTNGSVVDASRYPDGSTWQSAAAYASAQWSLQKNLTLTTGARYNQVIVNATFDDRFYEFPFDKADINTGALTGSAGLSWQPTSMFGSKLGFSTAFRAPNIDDVGKVFDSEPGSVVVPNPDLEPEYAYNTELGFTLNFNDFLKFDIDGFYTLLDNALVRRDFTLNGESTIDYQGEPSQVQAIQNAASAKVYGFEAGTEINFDKHFQLTSQLNITEGTQELDDGTEAPLRHAAPIFGNTHFKFTKNKITLDAFAEYNGEFSFEDLAPGEQDKPYLYAVDDNGNPYSPSWYTINLTAQYDVLENLKATATVENITDQRYRTYSSGIAAAGRNLILALSYDF
jgi:hemoglobin/transferrin/lactoferrin receptor protein